MRINRDNYEAWLLDLMEGKLTPGQEQELHDFLLQNPEYAPAQGDLENWEFESWALDSLAFEIGDISAGTMNYSGKAELKKELPHPGSLVSEKHFDMFSIARMEGDLTDKQIDDHQRIIAGDDSKKKEWLDWNQTRLKAVSVLFKGKDKLKKNKGQRSRILWISVASTAAALLLFFSIFISDRGEPVHEELVNLEKEESPGSDVSSDFEVSPDPEVPFGSEVSADREMSREAEGFNDAEALNETEGMVFSWDEENSKGHVSRNTLASGAFVNSAFSIKKHQDPPELTGEKRDTLRNTAKEESLQLNPVRIAMLEKAQMPSPAGVRIDRIEPLDLPALSSTSGKSSFQQFSEKGLRQSYREFLEENDISLLTIASAGIEGINFLAGSDLSLNISRDEKGKVSGFRFRGDYLSVDSPIKKEE